MEENNAEGAGGTTGAVADVDCQDEADYPSQKTMLPEATFLNSGHLASIDSACTSKKEASCEESPFKLRPGKSPKSRTPFKNQKKNPFKSMKRLFISPSKRNESKTCALKRHKSSDISSDEADVKSKKRPYNKSGRGLLNSEEIVAQDNVVINESLEDKATKANFNVMNVKSVIHHVLTNEQVLKMFKDVLESDQQDVPGQSSPKKMDVAPLDCLPKMTRARVREFLEKISMPSPVKTAREGSSIMDVEFNEEDDDDDYNPVKDEECPESDDESITSSKMSEFGSPYRSIASTSFMTPSRDTDTPVSSTVAKETTSDTVTECDLPTTSARNVDIVLTVETEPPEEELTDTIALRTRSKLPLTSTSMTEIESAFVYPDITTDMYDNNCDDADWVQFLSSLYKTADDAMTDDDADANDPEFNYIAEAEREQLDEEDFRFDKPTQITKKELTEMIEDLSDLFDDEVLPYQVVASVSEVTSSRKMQPGGQDMPFSSSPFKDTRVSETVPSTSSQFKDTRISQTVPSTSSQFKDTRISQTVPSTSSQFKDATVSQTMPSTFSPFKYTRVSQTVPSTISPFKYTRVSQTVPSTSSQFKDTRTVHPVHSSSTFSKFKTPQPLPQPLAHIKSNNSVASQPREQASSFVDSGNNSVSNTDTNAYVTPEQRALIADNIRKHIQLLMQSYMLSQNSPSLVQQTTESKTLITELSYLRHASVVGQTSIFNVCNLDPAVELLSTHAGVENNAVGNQVAGPLWMLSQSQKLTILNSPAFVYPHLLPVLTKTKMNERKYGRFSHSEDNLIALGLEQFRKCKDVNPVEQVHKLLIRGKTLEQVFFRVQYMSSGRVGDNPIKAVRKTGQLPVDFPKPTVDYFYNMAPKDQMSDVLPAWCSNQSSACKVQPDSNANLSQPVFISQLSQQGDPGISDLSIQIPRERMDHIQQTALSQIQPAVHISAVTQPVTFQTSPSVQLPSGLPPISGIYIQFSAPVPGATAAVPQVSPAVTFPSLVPSMSTIHEPRSKSAHSQNRQSTKRKITVLSSTSDSKKQRTQASPVINMDEVTLSNTCTQTDETSPDLLAKTMLVCGIEECTVCPSPQTQFQYSHDLDHLGMSFTSSTPVAQDKHPTVRNLNWEFNAAHRQSLSNIPGTQTQNAKKTYNTQSEPSCSHDSASQTTVIRNEAAVTPEHRSCLVSPLRQSEPGVNGEPRREEAAIGSKENLIPCTHSSSVSNHDLLCGLSKHTMASTGNDFDGSNVGSSQSQGIFSSNLPLTSEIVNMDVKKQPLTTAGENNSQEHELPREHQKFGDISSQGHLLMDITLQSQTENLDVVDSDLASDCTNQSDDDTCETVQNEQSLQPDINLSVQNDKDSLNNVTGTCEIVQDKQSTQSNVNLSMQNDKDPLYHDTETCDTVQDDQSVLSVQNDEDPLYHDTQTCDTVQDDQSAVSVQNDEDPLYHDTESCDTVQDDQSAQSVQNDENPLNNVTETNSTSNADILPVLTDDSSSSIDKTLTCASDNNSDSTSSNMSDNSECKIQTKPKTIRQILEASERRKTHITNNTSVVSPGGGSATLDTVNAKTDTMTGVAENTDMNKSTQDRILINDNSESSSSGQQTDTSTSSQGCSVTAPTINSFAVIGLQSPVKHFNSSNSNLPSPFKTPTKLRPLVPKTPSSAGSSSSSFVPLPKRSPKRKELNRHVRQILPKSFVFEIKSPSPTKTAAQLLKRKATLYCQNRSPVKLLPKQPQEATSGPSRSKPLLTPSRMFTRSQKTKVKNTGKKSCQETVLPAVKDPQPNKEKATVEPAVMETEDAVLSQEEEEEEFESDDQSQLDDLMAACTTIGYDPKKGSSGTDNDNKSKAQKKKDVCLSMLEPDIIDRDSKKDERDTAYAQHYFTHIKQVLCDDTERFKKFLTILHDMNRNHMSPVELYADMTILLSDHQDLVDDFAGFLLSFQAVECNCFVSYMEYQQILTFLRRLEIYCDSSNLTYQRTLKMMSRWLTMLNQESQADTTAFKEKIAVLLRHVPNIMDELQSYFFGASLPDSHPDDFEEADLDSEAVVDVDEFEEITLPEGREDYNTKLCSCQCHQDLQDEKLRRRIKHCYSCSLKIFDGKPVLKTSRNEYRPITVLYPLEEKEKMIKAKKEAAQLALAKARAQRQRKKRKGKKKNVGHLKSKNSKNIPLKKKFKRRKRCKPHSSSVDVGQPSPSITAAESKISEPTGPSVTESKILDIQDSVDAISQKQDKSDQKGTYSKSSDDQHKTSSGKLTEVSADVPGSVSAVKTSVAAETSSIQLTLITTRSSTIATVSHTPVETTVLKNQLESEPSALHKEAVDKSDMINLESHYDVDLVNSKLAPVSTSSHKSADSYESKPSPVTSVTLPVTLDCCLTGSDFRSTKQSVVNKQQSQMSTSELNISQPQVLPNPTHPVSGMSSALTLSQINSLSTPTAPFSRISADSVNVSRADKLLSKTVISTQNTFVSYGLQPRFATSPMLTSARIPVLVTIAPQQYLLSAKPATGNEMYKPRQKHPQMPDISTSVFLPQQMGSTKPSGKFGSHETKTDPSHNVIYSYPVCTQTFTSSASHLSSSFTGSLRNTEACTVPLTDGCPTTNTVSDSSTDATISLNSLSNFANLPGSFIHSGNPAVSVSVSSGEKLVPPADFQPSDTISSLPSTPVKGKIPAALVRAHLDNFSLGAFDASIGFSQLQQFAQSPNKQITDSMSKFDLLALIDSSNLGSKDFTLQSCLASTSSRPVAEPLLTFSGALKKLMASSNKSVLTASDTVHESQNISTHVTMENLPATSDAAGPHNQPSFDFSEGDDIQSDSIRETDDDLQSLCPKLDPSKMLLDDEASNEFVLSVWTEEEDRIILNVVTIEGITQGTVKKLHSQIPSKSVEEINSRARLLLQMLEQMGDTESDTDTDTSHN